MSSSFINIFHSFSPSNQDSEIRFLKSQLEAQQKAQSQLQLQAQHMIGQARMVLPPHSKILQWLQLQMLL